MTSFPRASVVSNLVPVWDVEEHVDEPVERKLAERVVEAVIAADAAEHHHEGHVTSEQATVVARPVEPELQPRYARLVTPPDEYAGVGEVTDPVPARSSYATLDEPIPLPQLEPLRSSDVEVLTTKDLALEALRGRILAFAQQRERRSAFEVAFILLSAAVAVLLAAPPLVRVLLAMRGIEA